MATVNGVPYPAGQTGIQGEFRAFGLYTLGASGATTNSGVPTYAEGLGTLTRNSAGNYTVTLTNSANRIEKVSVDKQIAAVVAGKGSILRTLAPTVASGSTTAVSFAFINVSEAAADVEDGAILRIEVICGGV